MLDIEDVSTPVSLKKKTADRLNVVGTDQLSSSWDERLRNAQEEVKTKYESRIAEVEKSYQSKVEMIERQCHKRLQALRQGGNESDTHERSPSAPEPKTFSFFKRLTAITRTESV